MRIVSVLGAGGVLIATILSATNLRAEDTRKKWQFGIGFSYWSTDDNIRSNSTTAYAPVDPSQAGTLPSIAFSDPRPDANEQNEPTIQDSFKLDFQTSFGLSRWVALQLDLSYFKGDVGDIEIYTEDQTMPISLSPQPPDPEVPRTVNCIPLDGSPPPPDAVPCYNMIPGSVNLVKRNAFLPVGQITEVPVSISGLVRFRPESPFDPYVGAGVGYIFTSLDTAASSIGTPIVMTASDVLGSNRVVTMEGFNDMRDFTNGLVVQSIRSGARALPYYPYTQTSSYPPTYVLSDRPTLYDSEGNILGTPIAALSATVNSGMEYHLMGGVDYYFTDRWSVYIDARYVWARSKVTIRIDNQTQILSGVRDFGCQAEAPICRTLMGVYDLSNADLLNETVDDLQDLILIQGGDIRLGGFSLGVGAKVTF